jgi:hypothetical protein
MVWLTLTVALSREALCPGSLYNTHCCLRSPLLLPCTHHPAKELLRSLGPLNHYLSRILRNGRVTEKYGDEEYLFLYWVRSGYTLTVICLSKYIVYQYSQLELLPRECVTAAHSAQARCSWQLSAPKPGSNKQHSLCIIVSFNLTPHVSS